MSELQKSPEYYEFLEKIRGLVTEYQEHIQPQNVCECHPIEGDLLLDRFILITTWLDEGSEEWLVRCNDKMPLSNVQGILHRMLFD